VYRILPARWPEHLAIALQRVRPGDILIVGSQMQRGLALNTIEQRALSNIEIRVEAA
jgi:hypothetical protein